MLTLLSLLACSAAPARPNILLVSIDTLRADRVGRRDAAGRSITPNLDAFAAEAAVFTEAYSQANETLYAHAALFSGRHPSDLGPLDDTRFDLADTPTLASSFRAAGYRTEAVVAGGHLAPEFGLQVGFARYASGRDFGSFQQTVPLALERLDALDDGGAPWLLFVHGYDVHAPYVTWGPLFRQDAPAYDGPLLDASLVPWSFEQILGRARYPGFRPALVYRGEGASVDLTRFDALEAWAAAHPDEAQPLDDADVAFVRALYDGAARYADHHVGILLAELDARGHRDDTVVVVLSDHGEDLLEHGHVNHRLSLHDENLHVPLLVRGSGVQAGVDGALVALVDVLPTLGELAGVAVPAGRGTSLFAPRPDRAVWSEAVRGEVSVRTSDGRLSVPAGASGPWPAQAPPRAFVTGPGGEDRAWEDPLGAALWRRLDEAAP